MKTSRILFPLLGALAGFGVTLLCLYIGLNYNHEWMLEILTPGIWVAEQTNSIGAGVFTMVLIGALIGFVIDLLISSADSK